METINIRKDELIRRLKLVPHEMIDEELFQRLCAKEWIPERGEMVAFRNADGKFDIGFFEGLSKDSNYKVIYENQTIECENIMKPADRVARSCSKLVSVKKRSGHRMSPKEIQTLIETFDPKVQQLLREAGISNAQYYAELLKHDSGLSGVELAKITNKTPDYIRTCMSTLIKKGLVRREGNKRFGCYHAISDPEVRSDKAKKPNKTRKKVAAKEDVEIQPALFDIDYNEDWLPSSPLTKVNVEVAGSASNMQE